MFEYELKTLTMKPYMWGQLNSLLSNEEYHSIVMDYQKREYDNLPKCKLLFGVCRYYSFGKCGLKHYCKNQIKNRFDS